MTKILMADKMTIVTINDVIESLKRNLSELKPVGENDLFGDTVKESDLIRSVLDITKSAANLARQIKITKELIDSLPN